MAYIWRFGGLGGHGRAYFSEVGRYSLFKTYVRSYNSFCNLSYLNKRINIKTPQNFSENRIATP